jgi:type IV secretory pathway component VirB8
MTPIFDTWVRFFFGLLLAAIVINVAVALIKPAVPYVIVIAAVIGAFQIARWWRERW